MASLRASHRGTDTAPEQTAMDGGPVPTHTHTHTHKNTTLCKLCVIIDHPCWDWLRSFGIYVCIVASIPLVCVCVCVCVVCVSCWVCVLCVCVCVCVCECVCEGMSDE